MFKPTKNPLIQPLKNKLHQSQKFSHFVIFGPQLIHENYELRQHSSHAIIFIGWAVEKKQSSEDAHATKSEKMRDAFAG